MAIPPKSPTPSAPPASAHPTATATPSVASATPAAGAIDVSQLKLSYTTGVCIGRLEAAQAEIEAWTKNLEKSLQEDVDNGALKVEEAAAVAAKHKVTAPKAKGQEPEAKATTPEMNQADMDKEHAPPAKA